MKKNLLSLFIAGIISFSFYSCDKSDPHSDPTEEEEALLEAESLLMDSTYFYFSAFSLWADEDGMPIPHTDADISAFTKNFKDADEVLTALRSFTPKHGPNGTPVDRFSFIDRAGQVGEEIGQGLHRDIGLSLQLMYLNENSNNVGLFVRLVQKNSPAEVAGLTRGMQILSVDGTTLALSTDQNGNVTGNIDVANKLYIGNVNSLRIRNWRTDTESTISIPNTNSYTADPIHKALVLDVGNKKVGYLAYTSFIRVLTNQQPNRFHQALTSTFDLFATQSVDELIVDLRYNGGGSTDAAELLTNLLIPSGHNGQIMYKYTLNNLLSGIPAYRNYFAPVHVNKQNTLNLTKVYFLVTSSTASASELVINSLKPYITTEIVSTQGRGTYGKPVGSFGYPVVNDMADLYITSFKLVNKDNQGDYYAGLSGDKKNSSDNILRELGDPQETMLNDALYHIQNGAYRSSATQARISRGAKSMAVPQAIGIEINQTVQGLYNLDYRPSIRSIQ